MRNQDFSNTPNECEKSVYGDYKFDSRFMPELFLGTRCGNGVEQVKDAWNDYISNVLMMDPDWPESINVFAWEGSKRGYFLRIDGKSYSREVKKAIVDCMTKHGFNAQIARYGGWIMTTNSNLWMTADCNKNGFKDRVHLGIINGLFDLITDESCQPFWD